MDNLPASLGAWQMERPDLAFDFSENDSMAGSALWSCDLPEGLPEAIQTLNRQESDMHRAIQRLERVPAQIESLVAQIQGTASPEVSFGPVSIVEIGQAEGFFIEDLKALDPANLPIHFGIGDSSSQSWKTAFDQFQKATDRIQFLINQLARVETRLGEKLIARTIINIKGDLQTEWEDPHNSEESALHLYSVRQALTSRAALLKMLSTAVQGALLAATLIGAPGSVLLALPATWRYIQTIMNQVSDSQQKISTTQEG